MAQDFNRITIVGRLTRDPELSKGRDGASFIRISVAVSNGKKKSGEEIPSIFYDALLPESGEWLTKYGRKGARVLVEGRHSFETYPKKDGGVGMSQKIVFPSVQLLDWPDRDEPKAAKGDDWRIPPSSSVDMDDSAVPF